MNRTIALTKRNILLFLRDRSAVFFSFLSTIIVVALYFLFIAKLYSEGLSENAGGVFSQKATDFMVYLQMMAGVLILNSMSLSVGVFSTAAKDFESRRIDSFLLSPLPGASLLASYLAAGFLVSFLLNLFTWAASAVIIGLLTGYFVSLTVFLYAALILLAASAVSGAIMLFITALVRSSAAIGVINGIAGTFFGFLCGIYIPYSSLGSSTKAIGSFLPYSHLTIWLKQTVLASAFSQLDVPPESRGVILDEFFSAKNIGFCGLNVPLYIMLILCGVFALACFALAWRMLRKRMR